MRRALLLLALLPGVASAGENVVSKLSARADGQKTVVVVRGSMTPSFTAYRLERPARVVVDVANGRLGAEELKGGPIDVASWAVNQIAVAEYADDMSHTARVMVGLARPSTYDVKAVGQDLVITVTAADAPPAGADAGKLARLEAARLHADETAKNAEARAQAASQRAERAEAAARAEQEKLAALRIELETATGDKQRQLDAEARRRQAAGKEQARQAEVLMAEAQRMQAAAAAERARADEEMRASKAQASAERARADEVARKSAERARAAEEKLAALKAELERSTGDKQRRLDEAAKQSERRAEEASQRAERAEAAARAEQEKLAALRAELETATGDKQRRLDAEAKRLEATRARADEEVRGLRAQANAERARADEVARKSAERARAAEEKLAALKAELERSTVDKQRRLDEAAKQAERRAAQMSERAERAEAAARAEREKLAALRVELETATGDKQRRLDAEAKRLEAARARADEEVRGLRAQANAERARADEAAKQSERRAAQASERAERAEAAARAEQEKLAALRAELETATGDKQRRLDAEAKRLDAESRKLEAAHARAAEEARTARAEQEKLAALRAELETAAGDKQRRLDAEAKKLEAAQRAQQKKAEALVAEAVRAAQAAAAAERARADEEARAVRAQATAERTRAEEAAKKAEARAAAASNRAAEAEAAARAEQDKLTALRAQLDSAKNELGRARTRASDGDAAFPRGGTHALSAPKVAPVGAALPLQVGGSGPEVPAAKTLPPSADNRARPQRRHYNGRRMDLDFVNADIHNILRLLSDVGQVNIVTSDDVKGTVTIRMHDVPWDQALDVILRSKSLGMQREGNLIRVAPLTVLEKELEAEVARQKAQIELRPLDTRLIPLSYADGDKIMARVAEVMSPRGHVSVDARTNQLIVTDVAGNIALAEDLVRNLDTQTPQVLIEARIVEARSTFLRDIGVQWGGNTINSAATGNPTGIAFPSTVGAAGGAVDNLTNANGLQLAQSGAASPNYVVNMPAAVGTGSGGALGITLGSLNGAINVNLRLSSLENTGQVRIISAPKIMTLDNIEASIEQGVSIPISQVSAAGVNTVFVDAKLNLTVKPHVTNEGSVVMNVAITRNEPDFVNVGARGDPTILKKQAKTEMLVRDGDTAVIGGIYTRNTGLSYTKVPWFAEIPILGWLFKNRRENDDRTELLIFITPRIVNRSVVAR